MMYRYLKLVVALALGLLALGQLSLAVKAYELRVQNEVLLSRVALGVFDQSGEHAAGPGVSAGGAGAIRCNAAPVVALHANGVEL